MPGKPKRPMSAFFLWLKSNRQAIKAKYPGMRVTQIAKKGGEIWRNMSDKRKWEEKAQQLREQYLRELGDYKARQRGASGERGVKRKLRRARSASSSSYSYDSD